MRRLNLILGLISISLFALFFIPVVKVAASGSCTGSSPIACAFTDAFDLVSNTVSVLIGNAVSFSDSFHFSEVVNTIVIGITGINVSDSFSLVSNAPQIIISNPVCTNAFVTSSLCNSFFHGSTSSSGQYIGVLDTSTNLGKAVTEIGIPVGLVTTCILLPARWGVKSFYIIFPIVNFVILGLYWIQVLPSYFVIFDIVIVAGGVSFIVLQLFTGSNSGNG